MTLGVCSHHAENSEIVEVSEASPEAAPSRAGCEQWSYAPKAWHFHVVHPLSSPLGSLCTWGAVGPPAHPGSTGCGRGNEFLKAKREVTGWSSAPHWTFSALSFADSLSLRRSRSCRNVVWRCSPSSRWRQDWH